MVYQIAYTTRNTWVGAVVTYNCIKHFPLDFGSDLIQGTDVGGGNPID